VPAIDPDRKRLLVHGLVEHPLVFTIDDLLRFPSVS
jgi:sulfane dehydrogenase subunit SoxC